MLMPGSPYRTYADNLYAYYQLKPNIAYQLGSSRSGLACVAYTRRPDDHPGPHDLQQPLRHGDRAPVRGRKTPVQGAGHRPFGGHHAGGGNPGVPRYM